MSFSGFSQNIKKLCDQYIFLTFSFFWTKTFLALLWPKLFLMILHILKSCLNNMIFPSFFGLSKTLLAHPSQKWPSLTHFRLNLFRLFLIHFFRCKLVFEVWHSVLVHHIFGSRLTWRIYLLPAKNNKSVIKREITTSAWHECHLCLLDYRVSNFFKKRSKIVTVKTINRTRGPVIWHVTQN